MTEQHQCPRCKTWLTLEDTKRLEKINCPQCQCTFVPAEEEYQREREKLAGMGKRFRWVLWIAFLSLPALFGWLKFQGVDFVNVGRSLETDILLKFSMALYYLSWSFGAGWDTAGMESYYAVAPNRGRIPLGTYLAIAALVGGGAVLCLVHTFSIFAAILAVFWSLNIVAWLYLGVAVKQTVTTSTYRYENELKRYDKLESLLAFDEQHRGPWQWWRWGIGGFLLAFINLLAFTPLSQLIGDVAGGVPGETILAISVLSFILAMEGWMWFTRIQAHDHHRVIGQLAQKYNLSPKTPLAVVPSTAAPKVKPMPVFSCTCGKLLKYKEDQAGKKAKCPGCHAVVTFPASSPAIA